MDRSCASHKQDTSQTATHSVGVAAEDQGPPPSPVSSVLNRRSECLARLSPCLKHPTRVAVGLEAETLYQYVQ